MSGKAAEREEPRDRGTPRPRPPASEPARILIVGGDADTRSTLVKLLRKRRHRCADVSRLAEARAVLAECRHDLILLNPELPDGDGLDLVRRHQKIEKSTALKQLFVMLLIFEANNIARKIKVSMNGKYFLVFSNYIFTFRFL